MGTSHWSFPSLAPCPGTRNNTSLQILHARAAPSPVIRSFLFSQSASQASSSQICPLRFVSVSVSLFPSFFFFLFFRPVSLQIIISLYPEYMADVCVVWSFQREVTGSSVKCHCHTQQALENACFCVFYVCVLGAVMHGHWGGGGGCHKLQPAQVGVWERICSGKSADNHRRTSTETS